MASQDPWLQLAHMLEQTTLECVKISKGNHTDQQERRAGSHQRGISQNLQSKRRRMLQHLHRLGLRSQLRQKGCVQYLDWQRNGWTNSRGSTCCKPRPDPVHFDAEKKKCCRHVCILKVAHSGCEGNREADPLARPWIRRLQQIINKINILSSTVQYEYTLRHSSGTDHLSNTRVPRHT